jgi:hypothetical protein
MTDDRALVERLAALEHDQWVEWSKKIAASETLSPERLARWTHLWCPYADLPEEVKEYDRVLARKVLGIIKATVGERGWEPLYRTVQGDV